MCVRISKIYALWNEITLWYVIKLRLLLLNFKATTKKKSLKTASKPIRASNNQLVQSEHASGTLDKTITTTIIMKIMLIMINIC